MDRLFSPVSSQVSFPELERRILAYWAERNIVARGLARNEGAEEWVFFEGPPTANGRPGVHHVEARIFKDIFPRFQAMRGRYVPRKAGWDCHGLPVELQIEKELGFKRKAQIEEASSASTPCAGSRCCATWPTGSASRSASGSGSTWTTPT